MELDLLVNVSPLTGGTVLIFVNRIHWRGSGGGSFSSGSAVLPSVSSSCVQLLALVESESENCSVVSDSLQPHELYGPWNSPGQNTGVGSLFLLQGILPTQGSKPGLLPCRRILHQLSHKGSPRILKWVPIPSPEYLPKPGMELGSPALQVDSLPTELSGSSSITVFVENP